MVELSLICMHPWVIGDSLRDSVFRFCFWEILFSENLSENTCFPRDSICWMSRNDLNKMIWVVLRSIVRDHLLCWNKLCLTYITWSFLCLPDVVIFTNFWSLKISSHKSSLTRRQFESFFVISNPEYLMNSICGILHCITVNLSWNSLQK